MSFISDVFSSDNGAGFQATQPNIQSPTTQGQIDTAYGQTQTGLQQQADFAAALAAQNGIGNQTQALQQQQQLQAQLAAQNGAQNQSQALAAQQALASGLQANNGAGNMGDVYGRQAAFVNAIGAQNGLGNQSQVFDQQQALAGQLQGVANGTGPNPALAQLNQATDRNISQQAALMAGQRGAGANAGLIARQAAMQGADIQQQAAGQAATMQAQQQIAGMGALSAQQQAMGQTAGAQVQNQGNQQAQLANIAATQVGQQAGQQAAVAGLTAQQIAQQQAQNQAVAGMATQQVGQQGTATQAYNQAAQQQQQNLLGAQSNYNNSVVSGQNNANTSNAGIAQGNQQFQTGAIGGILKSGGMALAMADGGVVPAVVSTPEPTYGGNYAGSSMAGRFLTDAPIIAAPVEAAPAVAPSNYKAGFQGGQALGGIAQQMLRTSSPQAAPNMGGGAISGAPMEAIPMAKGGKVKPAASKAVVPGKAAVKGDSLKNDKVPALLSPQEIVLPRSVTLSKDPVAAAAAFVQAILAKQNMRKA